MKTKIRAILITVLLATMSAGCTGPSNIKQPDNTSETGLPYTMGNTVSEMGLQPSGSSAGSAEIEQLKDVPEMRLSYSTNAGESEVSVRPSGSNWTFDNGDGTGANTIACGAHPLDFVSHMTTVEQGDGSEKLMFSFSPAPDSYTVRRWPDEYAGMAQEYADSFEIFDASDGTIDLREDNLGYIYEISARWPQGDGQYVFYLNS